MFTTIKTSAKNKILVTELTRKLNLGPENVIARLAFAFSIASGQRFQLSEIKDSQGKEYSKNVLFGNNVTYYIAIICIHYNIYKSDKDIAKYIKIHIDHGLELIEAELKQNPQLSGFDLIISRVDDGLEFIE